MALAAPFLQGFEKRVLNRQRKIWIEQPGRHWRFMQNTCTYTLCFLDPDGQRCAEREEEEKSPKKLISKIRMPGFLSTSKIRLATGRSMDMVRFANGIKIP